MLGGTITRRSRILPGPITRRSRILPGPITRRSGILPGPITRRSRSLPGPITRRSNIRPFGSYFLSLETEQKGGGEAMKHILKTDTEAFRATADMGKRFEI